MSKKDNLIECFKVAMDYMQKYVAIKTEFPDGKNEITIFERNSFLDKMQFYNTCFDDELESRMCPDMKIIDFCCANDFESIEVELLGE